MDLLSVNDARCRKQRGLGSWMWGPMWVNACYKFELLSRDGGLHPTQQHRVGPHFLRLFLRSPGGRAIAIFWHDLVCSFRKRQALTNVRHIMLSVKESAGGSGQLSGPNFMCRALRNRSKSENLVLGSQKHPVNLDYSLLNTEMKSTT